MYAIHVNIATQNTLQNVVKKFPEAVIQLHHNTEIISVSSHLFFTYNNKIISMLIINLKNVMQPWNVSLPLSGKFSFLYHK